MDQKFQSMELAGKPEDNQFGGRVAVQCAQKTRVRITEKRFSL